MVRRLRLFAAVMVALSAWVGLQLTARRVLRADELRYVPPGYMNLVATGTIRSTWAGMELHFGRVFREETSPGPLATSFRGLHDSLEKKGVNIRAPEDLAGYGLDIDRGIVAAHYGADDRTSSLYVVPIRPKDTLDSLLAAFPEGGPPTPGTPIDQFPVTRIGQMFLTRPDPTAALVSDDEALLRLGIRGIASNLEHAERSDPLYEGIKAMDGRLLSGASTLFVMPSAPAPLRRGWVVARLDGDALDIDGHLELQSAPWKVLRQFLAPAPRLSSWADQLSNDTAAALVLDDAAIASYIRFFGDMSAAPDVLRKQYGGVLWELQNVRNLTRAAVVATGYREGLPDLMLGVSGDADDLERLVEQLRTRFRVQRDLLVITKAIDAAGAVPSQASALKAGGFLQDETGALDGYTIQPNAVVPPALDGSAFEREGYSSRHGDATIRYLTPPITANDLRYRPELKALLTLPDSEKNRYRIGVTVIGGTYWFATNARDLERLLDAGSDDSLTLQEAPQFTAASSAWSRDDRLQLFINMDRTIRLGLLSPDSAIYGGVKQWLWELRDHPGVSLTIASDATAGRVRLRMRLIPRRALLP